MQNFIDIVERFNDQEESLEQVVSARAVHKCLEVKEQFTTWWKRCLPFIMGQTTGESQESTGIGAPIPVEMSVPRGNNAPDQIVEDYLISVDEAKILCMVSRTEKADAIRRYFIEVEKAWNHPMKLMQRALLVATNCLEKEKKLREAAEQKLVDAQPAIQFYDVIADTKNNIDFGAMAKLLGTGRQKLFNWCKEKKILLANTQPYQQYLDANYFDVVEVVRNELGFTKTLITPKGQKWLTDKWEKSRMGELPTSEEKELEIW